MVYKTNIFYNIQTLRCFRICRFAERAVEASFTSRGALFHAHKAFVDVRVPRMPFWFGCGRLPFVTERVTGPSVRILKLSRIFHACIIRILSLMSRIDGRCNLERIFDIGAKPFFGMLQTALIPEFMAHCRSLSCSAVAFVRYASPLQ